MLTSGVVGLFTGAVILSVVFDQTGSGNAEVYVSNTLRGTMAYTAPISSAVTFLVMTNRSKNASKPCTRSERPGPAR